MKFCNRTVSFSLSCGFISRKSSWAFELMNKFIAASVSRKMFVNQLCNEAYTLTNHSVVIIVLDTHRYIFDGEVHLDCVNR